MSIRNTFVQFVFCSWNASHRIERIFKSIFNDMIDEFGRITCFYCVFHSRNEKFCLSLRQLTPRIEQTTKTGLHRVILWTVCVSIIRSSISFGLSYLIHFASVHRIFAYAHWQHPKWQNVVSNSNLFYSMKCVKLHYESNKISPLDVSQCQRSTVHSNIINIYSSFASTKWIVRLWWAHVRLSQTNSNSIRRKFVFAKGQQN